MPYFAGEYAAAESLLRQVVDLRKQIEPPDLRAMAATLGNLAYLQETLGRLPEAEASYREASSGEGKGKADGLENLGRLHFKLGNPKAAVACFRQVLELESTIEEREPVGIRDHPHRQRDAGDDRPVAAVGYVVAVVCVCHCGSL